MAYEGYSGGGEDLADGSLRPFGNDYNSFDPRMESARFDSSFRAPEDFKPDHFGDEENKEGFDDFKGAGYEQPPPIYENEETVGQTPGAASPYMNFGSESPSDFAQRDYTPPALSPEFMMDMRGGDYNPKELDEELFAGEDPHSGAVLPPPEEMGSEEGHILREWKRQNALRLEEKMRVERDQLRQIVDDADDYKDNHMVKRKTNREAQMKNNREKEKLYLADQENFHKNADKAYWKAVADMVPKELPASLEPKSRQMKEKKEKKSTFVALPGPKPGKPTDMGRMRQVLLKLKHTPPAHMIPPPPPPPKPEVKPTPDGAQGEKGEKGEKGQKGEKTEAAVEVPDAPVEPEAPKTPEIALAPQAEPLAAE